MIQLIIIISIWLNSHSIRPVIGIVTLRISLIENVDFLLNVVGFEGVFALPFIKITLLRVIL